MAISREDKQDVKKHLGKALANKVGKVTNDSYMAKKKRIESMKGSTPADRGALGVRNDERKGSGRTQEIADRIKAEHFKTSGQTVKKKSEPNKVTVNRMRYISGRGLMTESEYKAYGRPGQRRK